VVPRVLVQELKQEVAEGQEHQRDGEHMGHGVLAQSVVVWELKQEHEVVPMLILSAVLHVLDHALKDDLADMQSPPRDGQDIQLGVLVQYDVDKELRQEQEHVLVVVLALHHVLVHLLKEGLVEGLEHQQGGHLLEHGVLVQSDVELEHKHEQEVV